MPLVPRSAWNAVLSDAPRPFRRRAATCRRSTRSVERELNSPAPNPSLEGISWYSAQHLLRNMSYNAK